MRKPKNRFFDPFTGEAPLKVDNPRKLDLRKKKILLSKIAMLLSKGYFGREEINFHEKNLKYKNKLINKFNILKI